MNSKEAAQTKTTSNLGEVDDTCRFTPGSPAMKFQGLMNPLDVVPNGGEVGLSPSPDLSCDPNRVSKRTDYIEWDEYFMGVARLSALRSKDPRTQVGACIVNPQKRIVGIGYNGMPVGCSDDDLTWSPTGPSYDKTKYAFVCHAEMNAIMNKNSSDLTGCIIYVDNFPCNECAKLIIQGGIKKVVYMRDKHREQPPFIASRTLLNMAKVEVVRFIPKKKSITISFDLEDELQHLTSEANGQEKD